MWEWQPTPVLFLPGKIPKTVEPGCSPWGIKELDRTDHKCGHT